MDLNYLDQLAELMQRHGLTRFELAEEEYSVVMEKAERRASAPESSCADGEAQGWSRGAEIVSPMVGVFYAAPSPEDKPFVNVGSRVNPGDVLCIIEAMKLMNEIKAEGSGVVMRILAENGAVVEYGQPLFVIGDGDE